MWLRAKWGLPVRGGTFLGWSGHQHSHVGWVWLSRRQHSHWCHSWRKNIAFIFRDGSATWNTAVNICLLCSAVDQCRVLVSRCSAGSGGGGRPCVGGYGGGIALQAWDLWWLHQVKILSFLSSKRDLSSLLRNYYWWTCQDWVSNVSFCLSPSFSFYLSPVSVSSPTSLCLIPQYFCSPVALQCWQKDSQPPQEALHLL